jgi:hypothetical protein
VEVPPGTAVSATIAGFSFPPGELAKQDIRFTVSGDAAAESEKRTSISTGLDDALAYTTRAQAGTLATITATLYDATGAAVCSRAVDIVTTAP